MALTVKNGNVVKLPQWERRRVSMVVLDKQGQLGFISTVMRLRTITGSEPPRMEGPVHAAWANLTTVYGDRFAEDKVQFLGALVSAHGGEYHGHSDWVIPLDTGKVMEQDNAVQ